eukprot:c15095_g1_i1.p2 GENE.c15095_g1_i1~~c15095_g1_i1.p2  ORF type:complete len:191 (+),score=23.63 c15095_g1_i1:77-649(+)
MFLLKRRAGRAPIETFNVWKVMKGDTVQLLSGKDKGRRGRVEKVIRSRNRVIVDGLNIVKRHIRRTEHSPGTIMTKAASVHVSTVSLLDPKDDKPTRVGIRVNSEGVRERYAVRSGTTMPKPVAGKRKPKDAGPKDTLEEVVRRQTFQARPIDLKLLRDMAAAVGGIGVIPADAAAPKAPKAAAAAAASQ